MIRGAGILFLSLNGTALFLRRSAASQDFAGYWDLPGGGQDGDESTEQTAIRETREEIGFLPEGVRSLLTRQKGAPVADLNGGAGSATAAVPVTPPAAPAPAPPASAIAAGPMGAPGVDYSTFLQKVTNEFTPELNDEHDGWAWVPVASPPAPLHPGCSIALERLTMNELGIARAIAANRLTSPQRYENMWLVAIRITGTGYAYRPKLKEFVFRDPKIWLNDEALARCNGLTVIYKHPKGQLLDSDEFAERVVGSIFLPYIGGEKGDEVWGIAKVYDEEAGRELEDGQLSTSPAVYFHDLSVNQKLTLENGAKLLVEGDPSLLDHVALCSRGVWDKGDEISGVRSESREDSAMTPEEEAAAKKAADDAAKRDAKARDDKARDDKARDDKARDDKAKDDAARKDADAGKNLDDKLSEISGYLGKMADAVSHLGRRMDSMEEKDKARDDARRKDDAAKKDAEDKDKGEAEKLAADKAKKDAEDKEKEEKEKADKAKKDAAMADSADVKRQLDELSKLVRPLADDEHAALADAWTEADRVYPLLGKQTPRPIPGETSKQFRRRTTLDLQVLSPRWKGVDLKSAAFADDAAFNVASGQILEDSIVAARDPTNIGVDVLRMVERVEGGHTYRDFYGQPSTWMSQFAGQTGRAAKAPGANFFKRNVTQH